MSVPHYEHASRARRRRRALAHQCPDCRANWSLQVIHHPAGSVINCRNCGEIRMASRTPAPAPPVRGLIPPQSRLHD